MILTGDGLASAPRVALEDGEAVVRLADGEAGQAVFLRVAVRFERAFVGPVGAAEAEDRAFVVVFVQDFHDLVDRIARVVAVQDVDVKAVCAQVLQGLLDLVAQHLSAVDVGAAFLAGVEAFVQNDDLILHAARLDPCAEVLFSVGVLSIGMRGVKDAEPSFPGRIQRLERLLAAPCVDRLHCAVDETGRSLIDAF